jgi:hypothetical protein
MQVIRLENRWRITYFLCVNFFTPLSGKKKIQKQYNNEKTNFQTFLQGWRGNQQGDTAGHVGRV